MSSSYDRKFEEGISSRGYITTENSDESNKAYIRGFYNDGEELYSLHIEAGDSQVNVFYSPASLHSNFARGQESEEINSTLLEDEGDVHEVNDEDFETVAKKVLE